MENIKMKANKILGIALITFLLITACKPTEKNYQQAYNAAKAKREAAAAETMIPASGLMSDDGPQLRVINKDSVFVDKTRLRNLDDKKPEKMWYIAVGTYKMNTNAKANAENLRSEGYENAAAFKSYGNKWFTVSGGANNLDTVVKMSKEFQKKHPDYPYVGLPGAPVLLYNL